MIHAGYHQHPIRVNLCHEPSTLQSSWVFGADQAAMGITTSAMPTCRQQYVKRHAIRSHNLSHGSKHIAMNLGTTSSLSHVFEILAQVLFVRRSVAVHPTIHTLAPWYQQRLRIGRQYSQSCYAFHSSHSPVLKMRHLPLGKSSRSSSWAFQTCQRCHSHRSTPLCGTLIYSTIRGQP